MVPHFKNKFEIKQCFSLNKNTSVKSKLKKQCSYPQYFSIFQILHSLGCNFFPAPAFTITTSLSGSLSLLIKVKLFRVLKQRTHTHVLRFPIQLFFPNTQKSKTTQTSTSNKYLNKFLQKYSKKYLNKQIYIKINK